jgi:valyl-tRNA synthetase
MDFPKKYKFQDREKFWMEYWKENETYKFDEESDQPLYIVDTPPPYASAQHLHPGHVMSYGQAEYIVRYKRMRGYNVFYPFGYDDNGLPTERYVEKAHNIENKHDIKRSDFIDLCLQETGRCSKNYTDLFTRLGTSVDWSKTYSTISPKVQKISQWSFIDLYNKGKVYRKEEPVLWCPFCETALAQADVEDMEMDSKLNYINFSVGGEEVTIATTRPELIPACVALFAHPEDDRYSHMKGKTAQVPLFDYEVPVLFDESVDPEYGTGIMMVCSWGDTEDIEKLKAHELEARQLLTEDGKLSELGGDYEGMKVEEAREKIISELSEKNLLVKQENLKHAVNTHERCNTPIEFIAKPQWFINVLDEKEAWLKRGDELNWYPKHMKKKYQEWVEGLKWDWCISRTRYYGVPFPLWYHKETMEPILPKLDDLPVHPMEDSPPQWAIDKYGKDNIIPETDVLDTWATSSCTPMILPDLVEEDSESYVIQRSKGELSEESLKVKLYPASLRPQGFDIIRTWLFYTIVKAHYHFDSVPFEDVMLAGMGVAKDGSAMSKRKGNYLPPQNILNDFGADAFRYWTTGALPGRNHRFDVKELKKGKHTVNKIWNASRLVSMILGDAIKESDLEEKDYLSELLEEESELEPEDKWILHELNEVIKKATNNFENYDFASVRREAEDFFWGKYCDYYLEMVKHRRDDKAAQSTLYKVLLDVVKLYAPILPFISEEIYSLLYKEVVGVKSIHVSEWPEVSSQYIVDSSELKKLGLFIEEIDNIRKVRGEKKIGFSETLEGYEVKTEVDLEVFGEKLEEVGNVKISG